MYVFKYILVWNTPHEALFLVYSGTGLAVSIMPC